MKSKPALTNEFRVDVDGRNISIPVSATLLAHFHEQFPTRTDPQRHRRKTLKELMRAAYRKGSSPPKTTLPTVLPGGTENHIVKP